MSRFLLFNLIRRCLNSPSSLEILNTHRNQKRMAILRLSTRPDDSTQFTTRLALPADTERIIDFMRKTYFKTEPTLVNIGLNCCEEPPPQLVHLMRKDLMGGFTIIAESCDNCVVGAAINIGSCPWDPQNMIQYAECCCDRGPVQDVVKFFAHVTGHPNLWSKYCVLKVFECAYLCVGADYCGMGIGKRLVNESWKLARECGFKVFRIDCTSRFSAKIAERYGWECVFTIPYRRYINCGDFVFKNIQEPHTEVKVFVDLPLIGKNDR